MAFGKVHIIAVLVKKELKLVFFDWIFYLTICAVFLISSFILENIIGSIQGRGIRAGSDPLIFPYLVAMSLSMVYISLSSVVSIVKEKNEGTLLVLFYGPIRLISYILSKYFKELIAYGVVVIFIVIYFLFISFLTNLNLSIEFVQIIISSFFLASCLIGLGLFISTLTTGITKAIILFILIVLGFSGIEILHRLLLNLSLVTGSTTLGYFRESAGIISKIMVVISPLSYFLRSYDAVYSKAPGAYSVYLCFSIIYTLFFLLCSRFMLKYKGIIPKG